MASIKKNIAVLMTCHNRRDNTITCLISLYSSYIPKKYSFDVFLVDDGSTDGTSDAIRERFPFVNIIQGDGQLFWNKGMRLAWDTAKDRNKYDYYFWLNDDTLIDKHALCELLGCNKEAIEKNKKPAIIVGACRISKNKYEFSYGGRINKRSIIPNGLLQACEYINGNAVLIPKTIYDKIGNLSPEYTHAIGDFDYGLRAINAGYYCYTTKTYIATCPKNEGIPGWCNPQISLKKRLELLHSPKGLNIKEQNIYYRKFWGWKWVIFSFKVYLKVIFPSFYNKLANLKF